MYGAVGWTRALPSTSGATYPQSLEAPYICIVSYSGRTGRLYIVKAFSRAINTQLTECDEVGYVYCTYDLSRAIISSNSKGTCCA